VKHHFTTEAAHFKMPGIVRFRGMGLKAGHLLKTRWHEEMAVETMWLRYAWMTRVDAVQDPEKGGTPSVVQSCTRSGHDASSDASHLE
jgi:hypothetical protein